MGLFLTKTEQAMLGGEHGLAVQRAMEIIVALAKIYDAQKLVEINSVQVAGVSYKNLGPAGLDFLREWAGQGARVRASTTLNPAGMDLTQWSALGFSRDFARQQQAVLEAYAAMGIELSCTCTPYLIGNRPRYGEHIAWAESSAVSFANSALGARTNREGGPSALAAAICGRTAAYGLHLDENRVSHCRIDVYCPLAGAADWSALGYLIGRTRCAVPYLVLHAQASSPTLDDLKSLGAAMAASGAQALYHIAGVTPEAQRADMLAAGAQTIAIRDLAPGYAALNDSAGAVDLVSIGCPHASKAEIAQIAALLQGKRVKCALWITTARKIREEMRDALGLIQAAGGRVVADTCLVVAPVEQLGFKVMATNSAKMAFYTPSHSGLRVRFGSLAQCLEAAISGVWR